MLVIRYKRIGKRNKPTYRIVAAEHSMPVNGKFVEDLGFYNPHTKASGLKTELIMAWLKNGAKPSNSVAKLFSREKLKHRLIVVVKKNKKAKSKEEDKPQIAAQIKVEETSSETPEAETQSTETETQSTTSDSTPSSEDQPQVASETEPTVSS